MQLTFDRAPPRVQFCTSPNGSDRYPSNGLTPHRLRGKYVVKGTTDVARIPDRLPGRHRGPGSTSGSRPGVVACLGSGNRAWHTDVPDPARRDAPVGGDAD